MQFCELVHEYKTATFILDQQLESWEHEWNAPILGLLSKSSSSLAPKYLTKLEEAGNESRFCVTCWRVICHFKKFYITAQWGLDASWVQRFKKLFKAVICIFL